MIYPRPLNLLVDKMPTPLLISEVATPVHAFSDASTLGGPFVENLTIYASVRRDVSATAGAMAFDLLLDGVVYQTLVNDGIDTVVELLSDVPFEYNADAPIQIVSVRARRLLGPAFTEPASVWGTFVRES